MGRTISKFGLFTAIAICIWNITSPSLLCFRYLPSGLDVFGTKSSRNTLYIECMVLCTWDPTDGRVQVIDGSGNHFYEGHFHHHRQPYHYNDRRPCPCHHAQHARQKNTAPAVVNVASLAQPVEAVTTDVLIIFRLLSVRRQELLRVVDRTRSNVSFAISIVGFLEEF